MAYGTPCEKELSPKDQLPYPVDLGASAGGPRGGAGKGPGPHRECETLANSLLPAPPFYHLHQHGSYHVLNVSYVPGILLNSLLMVPRFTFSLDINTSMKTLLSHFTNEEIEAQRYQLNCAVANNRRAMEKESGSVITDTRRCPAPIVRGHLCPPEGLV